MWDATTHHRWSPLLLSLQHRPTSIEFAHDGLELAFSGPAGYLAVSPLYGLSAPTSPEERAWPASGLPPATLERITTLDRLARAFPEGGSERWSVEPNGDARLQVDYTFLTYPDAWNTTPLRLASLPPSLALAAWPGPSGASPITINGQPFSALTDLDYLTPLGRLAGVPNASSATVLLPGVANLWRGGNPLPNPGGSPGPRPGDPAWERLVDEVEKIVAAGHLLPGYGVIGIWEGKASGRLGDDLADYWHNPADMAITLLQALPWLPAGLQDQVRDYLRREQRDYPLENTAHVGWKEGANRAAFDLPPEVLDAAQSFGPSSSTAYNRWGLPPINQYALAYYAAEFGDAGNLFNKAGPKLDTTPRFNNSLPYVLNSYLAGYFGYLRLAQAANAGPQPQFEATALHLITLRIALSKFPAALAQSGFEFAGYQWTLRKFAPDQDDTLFIPAISGSLWSQLPLYGFPTDPLYGLSGASTGGDYAFGLDFLHLVPETAALLRSFAPQEVALAVASYTARAPYWFLALAPETGGEGVFQPLYDRHAYFQAQALVLDAPRSQLELLLDVPAFPTGDLFFIQNLIAVLEAGD